MSDIKPVRLSNVDFCVAAMSDSKDGLERLLHSIIDIYPTARIIVADNDLQLDRKYYKQLRKDLGEAGLVNRLQVHHIAYQAGIAESFNRLLSLSRSTYRLLLTDEDVFTAETDVKSMIRTIEANKTVGIVSGVIGDERPTADGKPVGDEDLRYSLTKQATRFMLVQGDVINFLRFDPDHKNPIVDFCTRAAKRLPYKIAISDARITNEVISDDDDENETTGGDDNGGAAGTDLPSGDDTGNDGPGDDGDTGEDTGSETAGDDTSVRSGQDEESQDSAPSRRSGGNGTRSRRRQNN